MHHYLKQRAQKARPTLSARAMQAKRAAGETAQACCSSLVQWQATHWSRAPCVCSQLFAIGPLTLELVPTCVVPARSRGREPNTWLRDHVHARLAARGTSGAEHQLACTPELVRCVRSSNAKRRALAWLCQKAAASVSASAALVAAPAQASLYNEVPSRVRRLPFALGPLIGDRVSTSEVRSRASPQNAQHHSEREARRHFSGLPERLRYHVLWVHACSPFGEFVSVSVPQPHCGWKTFTQSLSIAPMTGNPDDVDGLAANVVN